MGGKEHRYLPYIRQCLDTVSKENNTTIFTWQDDEAVPKTNPSGKLLLLSPPLCAKHLPTPNTTNRTTKTRLLFRTTIVLQRERKCEREREIEILDEIAICATGRICLYTERKWWGMVVTMVGWWLKALKRGMGIGWENSIVHGTGLWYGSPPCTTVTLPSLPRYSCQEHLCMYVLFGLHLSWQSMLVSASTDL